MKRTSIALLLLVLSSCTDGFTDINTNPNAPEEVDAQFLLANVLYNAANNNAVDGWENGNLLAQLTTKFDFNDIDRFILRENAELWTNTYFPLRDNQTVLDLAEQAGNDTYKGIALVMRAYLAATVTDLWGDGPYTEALQGKIDNFTPAYDTQEQIYTGTNGILASLREAVDVLEASTDRIAGDVIYAGNTDAWIRFANALRVRYLMRIEKRQDPSSELQQIVGSGRLFQSNADNAVMPYLATAPNQWSLFTARSGDYNNVRMSKTIETVLKQYDDPRLFTLFKPTAVSQNTANPVYTGLQNGLAPTDRANVSLNEISTLGAIFRDVPDGVNAILMTYPELQFTLAEAALKGYIGGDAQAYYEAGVRAAFLYLEADDPALEMPADYLQRPGVAFDTNTALEQIMTQKWLANFLNGYEAWCDFRRTGLPKLTLSQEQITNNGGFPSRFRYPVSEQAVNLENYTIAVNRMGNDNHNVKAWWEE